VFMVVRCLCFMADMLGFWCSTVHGFLLGAGLHVS